MTYLLADGQITLIPATRRVRLLKLAKKLRVSTDSLLNVLKQGGYVLKGNKGNIVLNTKQLDLIAIAYSAGLKNLFKKYSKDIKSLSSGEKTFMHNFFSRFIPNAELYDEETIYTASLDNNLTAHLFYSIIESIDRPVLSDYDHFIRKLIRVKLKMIKAFQTLQQKTISTFIRYHYYNFSKDEEEVRSKSVCFS